MIVTIIILLNICYQKNLNLTNYSNQFINYMGMYRLPIVLATNYMKSFLNVGNSTKVKNQIATATANFLASSQT
jgi:hypothetical protein